MNPSDPSASLRTGVEFVAVAHVLRPRGIKGELKVELLTDRPEGLAGLHQVWLETPDGQRCPAEIVGVNRIQGDTYIRLRGITSRTEAETLRGAYFLVPRSESPPLPEGTFYVSDLLGMAVEAEDGTPIGTLEDVDRYPANDVYVVRHGEREILIPAAKDIVRCVDVKARRMVIAVREGLVE